MSAGADCAEAVATLMATMREFYRCEAPISPGGRVIELDGATAFLTPTAPTQSIVNGVICDSAHALAAHLDDVTAFYRAAGVSHWMVWTAPGDAASAARLRAAGHLCEYEPQAMWLALDELREPPADPDAPPFELVREPHALEIAILNEHANGLPAGAFGAAFAGLRDRRFHRYLARVAGAPAACLVTFDHGGDCIVNWVATAPAAQRRRLAGRLLHAALRDARERGARSSTLQSSYEGERLYEGLGYVAKGRLGMWLSGSPA
ncbi:MAG: GCN5-related N-acetyltransferase [Conexibacter sp.]|nr:GCN5-related N-acetyltransferase [Conexibacter sp.]